MSTPSHPLTLPPSLAVPRPGNAGRVARALVLLLVGGGLFASFAPWQQTVLGSGRVVAFSADQRQQGIGAPVSGRVARWHVEEGALVRTGEPVVELQDNDTGLMSRLHEERAALAVRLEMQESQIVSLQDRIESLQRSQNAQIFFAEAEVDIARQALAAAKQKSEAIKAELDVNTINLRRQRDLEQQGLASRREFELAELAVRRNVAEVATIAAEVQSARQKVAAQSALLERVRATAEADIHSAQASLRDTEGAAAATRAQLARAAIGLSRQAAQTVFAPIDGTMLRILVRQGAEQVSQGETLALIVPETDDRSVEIYVDGNDATLIKPNDPVRLQFEGWPAVQFIGWPSVAVGTFGGRVVFVDAADDGQGNFRVLVKPDNGDEPWPEPKYLRQGVRSKAWFMLRQVTVGFEIWRHINGFPPSTTPPVEEK